MAVRVTAFLIFVACVQFLCDASIVRYDSLSEDDVFTTAELDKQTGALYVSAGSTRFYRFSSMLRVEAEYMLSSVCDDDEADCSRCPTDNSAAAAASVSLASTAGLLLACGGPCGRCYFLNSTVDDDVDAGQHRKLVDPTNSASSRVLGVSPAMTFASQNQTDNATQRLKLFVAGSTTSGLEAVSVRETTWAADSLNTAGQGCFCL